MLYALGSMARAGELLANGYSVQDVLPLSSLEQLLARGLSILLDPAVVIAALLFVPHFWNAMSWRPSAHPDATDEFWHNDRANALGWCALVWRQLNHVPGVTFEELSMASRSHADLIETNRAVSSREQAEQVVEGIAQLAHALVKIGKRTALESREYDYLRRLSRKWDWGRRLKYTPLRWGFFPIAVVIFLCMMLTTEISSLPFWIAIQGWALLASTVWLTKLPRRRQLLILALPFLAAAVASAYLDTRPLPRATITADDGSRISGDLIASSGSNGSWYVGISDAEVVAVPSDHVRRVNIERDENARQPYNDESIIKLVFN
jgi:hypothetical protein